jgi:hypothetical protein
MAFSKDIERLVRAFVAQKLELEYIRHYLMENYQLDRRATDEILTKIGVKLPAPGRGGAAAGEAKGDKGKVNKTSFY